MSSLTRFRDDLLEFLTLVEMDADDVDITVAVCRGDTKDVVVLRALVLLRNGAAITSVNVRCWTLDASYQARTWRRSFKPQASMLTKDYSNSDHIRLCLSC